MNPEISVGDSVTLRSSNIAMTVIDVYRDPSIAEAPQMAMVCWHDAEKRLQRAELPVAALEILRPLTFSRPLHRASDYGFDFVP